MKKIIFVCTGNTCRSPIAEVIANKIFYEKSIDIEVASRGIHVSYPSQASEYSIMLMKKQYPNIIEHISRAFRVDEVDTETLVLTMTIRHKEYLHMLYPNISNNIYTLKEFIDLSGDIVDPYGGTLEMYNECANEISYLINELTKKIINTEENK
ncbi:MAG: low molecular weight protein arginine phosphatase [Vallitalea sp.]|nr:low molecular weight protein arginine phosphatase [Vallitalea sp.]